MSITTSGQISMTPVLIETTATLEDLVSALADHVYRGVPGEPGWGSVSDDTDDIIGDLLARSRPGGQPDGVIEHPVYPRQVRARLYWDQEDRALVRAFGTTADPERTHRLRAADITFASLEGSGTILGLLGERNDQTLRRFVLPAVESLLQSIDRDAYVSQDNNPLRLGEDDFFRWILYRATHDYVLSDDLEVVRIRAMSNQDRSYRPTSMSRGVTLDRPEALALISQGANRFGPAKIVVRSSALRLTASMEVTANGQFSVYRSGSEYDLDRLQELEETEEDSEGNLGLRLVQDVSFELLPELRRLHAADRDWRERGRAAFMDESRSALREALQD